MELNRISLPPLATPGEVITFYAYESGPTRSVALSNLAVLLAGRQNATVPVLMIDWDTESPGLDRYFDEQYEHGGVLEYFTACGQALDRISEGGGGRGDPADTALAQKVLDAVPWQDYVTRVDETRPLYLMRAARMDDSFGARAAALDWEGLFQRCPALFRAFADLLSRHFRHVLVDARGGRSAQVAICTTFLPRKLVALFSPSQRSLDGLLGVVQRAIDYRRSHEEEQRRLVVYPLPCSVDSADSERRRAWRWGDRDAPGYQPVLEQLLREAYGQDRLSLNSYFDEVQLQHSYGLTGARLAAHLERGGDRFSLTRTFEALLDWVADGFLPWQSRGELQLLRSISAARLSEELGSADGAPLARDLQRLGEIYLAEGRMRQALPCFEESTALRQRLFGDEHPETRSSRARLAAVMQQAGQLSEARFLYELLLDDARRLRGPDHPDALTAGLGLAGVLSRQGDHEQALGLHEEMNERAARLFGSSHEMTLSCLAAHADALVRANELSRARMLYERVLDGRQRLLGQAHEDTLACMRQLALLLLKLGDHNNAKALQETLLSLRERHNGLDSAAAQRERDLLADILTEQGDLAAAGALQSAASWDRTRARGQDGAPPSLQRSLAASLARQGELDKLRTMHESVMNRSLRQAARPGVAAGLHGPLGGEVYRARVSPSVLDEEVVRLRRLLELQELPAAREVADGLRAALKQSDVGDPLRRGAGQLIKQTYQMQGDKDALVAFQEEQLTALEGALCEAQSASG